MTTQHLMYFWAVGLTRLAIVAFLLRMSSDSKTPVRNPLFSG